MTSFCFLGSLSILVCDVVQFVRLKSWYFVRRRLFLSLIALSKVTSWFSMVDKAGGGLQFLFFFIYSWGMYSGLPLVCKFLRCSLVRIV